MDYIDRVSLNNEIYNVKDAFGRAIVANEFDSAQEYNEGDLVLYGENLYKCLSSGSGSWDFNNWSLTTLVENLGGGDSGGGDIDALIERTAVSFSGSQSVIGSFTFAACYSLQSVNFPNCSTIGSNAFSGCYSLQSISFPNCSTIGSNAFQGCTSLQSAKFPNCTSIGIGIFSNCSSLRSASFPNCAIISDYAFQFCRSLQLVDFPSCTIIGTQAFYGCSSLRSIKFSNCIIISNYAFQNCKSLYSINFPQCSHIGNYAFQNCKSLYSINFPQCSHIGNSAFQNCSTLSIIYLSGSSICTLSNSNAFKSTPMALSSYLGYFGSIYVPSSLVDSYKSATNWTYYSSRITAYIP